MVKKRILLPIVFILIILVSYILNVPDKRDKLSLDIEVLDQKGITEELLIALPKTILEYISKYDSIDRLVAIDQKNSKNLKFGSLIFTSKEDEEWSDYYLFVYYKTKYSLPFERKVLLNWNRDDYTKISGYSYVEGYDYLNRFFSKLYIVTNYTEFELPILKSYEGYTLFKVRKRGNGNLNFNTIYKGILQKNLKSYPEIFDSVDNF